MATTTKRAPKSAATRPSTKPRTTGPIAVTLADERSSDCQCGRMAVYLVQRPNNNRRTATCGYHLSKVVGDFAHA